MRLLGVHAFLMLGNPLRQRYAFYSTLYVIYAPTSAVGHRWQKPVPHSKCTCVPGKYLYGCYQNPQGQRRSASVLSWTAASLCPQSMPPTNPMQQGPQ
jgi:hypothetical protein